MSVIHRLLKDIIRERVIADLRSTFANPDAWNGFINAKANRITDAIYESELKYMGDIKDDQECS